MLSQPGGRAVCKRNELCNSFNLKISFIQYIVQMMIKPEMPALILRSLSLKAISALRDLGLNFSTDIEIDLVLAIVSGDFLHVVACAVKRVDSYPWQKESSLPNRQAVNKADNQLTKDVGVLMNILAGIPQSHLIFHTLACFPDIYFSQLVRVRGKYTFLSFSDFQTLNP